MAKIHSKIRTGLNLKGVNGFPSDAEEGDLVFRSDMSPARFYIYRSGTWNSLNDSGYNKAIRSVDNSTTGNDALLSDPQTPFISVTNSSLNSIAMIPVGEDGETLIISNNSGSGFSLLDDTGATANARIRTGSGNALNLEDNASCILVYNATTNRWHVVGGSGGGGGWALTGNAGTNPNTNFIGTTDNQPLVFKINNIERIRLDTEGRLNLVNNTDTGSVSLSSKVAATEKYHLVLPENSNTLPGATLVHKGNGNELQWGYAGEQLHTEAILNNAMFPITIGNANVNHLSDKGFVADYVSQRTSSEEFIPESLDTTDTHKMDTLFLDNVVGKFNNTTNSIAVQPDGKVLVGGNFMDYGGVTGRDRLVRLNSDGTVDTAFCANAVDGKFSSGVYSIAVQPDGKVLVGGQFSNYGGTFGRNYLIRLNSDGTLDTAFCVNAVDGGKFNQRVSAITVQPDGKVLVGGDFTNYGGTTGRNYLIRLNSDGTLDTAFCVNAVDGGKFSSGGGSGVRSIAAQPDGRILVGGAIANYGGVTGRSGLIRLNSDGTLDTAFCVNAVDGTKFNNTIYPVVVQPDGKVLVGGAFSNYGGTTGRHRLVRLNSDGTLDTAFCVNAVDGAKFSSIVDTIAVQTDGKVLVGGGFSNYGGTTGRNRLIGLNSDGTQDTAFNANAVDGWKFDNTIQSIATQPDGKILVGGLFTNYNNITGMDRLICLEPSKMTDTQILTYNSSWKNKFDNIIYSIAVQADGKVLVGGGFNDHGGELSRNKLVRLNSDGSVDVGFTNNAADGNRINANVHSIAVQPDGKVLVGGNFTNYNGTTGRSYLVRLNSNGTQDTAFNTNAVDGAKFNGGVYSIAVQPDGKILIGGFFNNYNGTTGRNRLVRLNPDGTLDAAFCANAVDGGKFSSDINFITVQADGKVLVGGNFTGYGGTTGRNSLIRLNSDGTVDTAFCANAVDGAKFSSNCLAIVVQPDGKVLVGGAFSNYGGASGRDRLVRLNSNGTQDTAFNTNAVDGAKFNGSVYSIAVQPDGKVLVGGSSTNYGGTTGRNRLVRLNPDGTLDAAFCANAVDGNSISSTVRTFASVSNNELMFGGAFINYKEAGYSMLASISYVSSETESFNINAVDGGKFGNDVTTLAIQPDGKILVGGYFANYNGTTGRNRLVRLNSDGTLDTAFCVNAVDGTKFNNYTTTLAMQPDGKVLVGGNFTGYGGTSGRDKLIRLNSDGTLDTAFCANAVDGGKFTGGGIISSVVVQADGKVLVGGGFTNYNSTTGRSYLIRLNSDGTLDTAFNTNAVDGAKFNSSVSAITVQSDGKVLVGGNFTNYNSTTGRSYLIRLNSDGTLDTAFCANAVDGGKFNNPVVAMAIQSDGKVAAVGYFANYNSTTGRSYLIRLNSDGTLDTAFCANAVDGGKLNDSANHIITQPDGKILVGGYFANYNGTTGRNRLVRLNSDGTLDTAFCVNAVDGTKFNNYTTTLAMQPDGKVLVGGNFTGYNSTTGRNRLVMIQADVFTSTTETVSFKGFWNGSNWLTGAHDYFGEPTGVNISVSNDGNFQYTSSDLGTSSGEIRLKVRKL